LTAKLRVLFVNPLAELGGSERSLLDLLASLRATAPDVEPWLLLLGEGALAERARELGVPVEIAPVPPALGALGESKASLRALGAELPALVRSVPAALGYVAALRRVATKLRPRIVHTNGMKAHLLMALAVPELPRVIHLRDFASERPVSRHALPFLARGSLVLTNSRAVEDDARRVAPRARTRTVYNGIDLDEFRPGPRELEHLARLAQLPVPASSATIVGMVATRAWWKGHRTFLRAAALVRAAEPAREFRFYVVGGAIYGARGSEISESELAGLVAELGLAECVGLVPFQHDAAAVYRGLDIVVHPSERPEPFGRTIVEAMAMGRPVVVSRAGGAAELFVEGESALGHQPGDAAGLARAVLELARDEALRARLGTAARAEARARFDRRRLGREVSAAYGELLDSRLG
jgi:glycosyltransferase involved in cell wall biosynthesis